MTRISLSDSVSMVYSRERSFRCRVQAYIVGDYAQRLLFSRVPVYLFLSDPISSVPKELFLLRLLSLQARSLDFAVSGGRMSPRWNLSCKVAEHGCNGIVEKVAQQTCRNRAEFAIVRRVDVFGLTSPRGEDAEREESL